MPEFPTAPPAASAAGPPAPFAPTIPVTPAVELQFAQKAFILDGDRLLLVRKSETDPNHPGLWEVPGGRLPESARLDLDLDDDLRREVWEEVGIKIDPGPPFHLWQWLMPRFSENGRSGATPWVRVVAVARTCGPVTTDITMENQVPGDHLGEAAWVRLAELAGYHLIPDIRPVIHKFLRLHSAG